MCIHCQIISHFYDFLVILPPPPEALGRGKDEGTDLGDDEGVSLGLFVGTADGCKVGMPDGKTLGNVVGLEVGVIGMGAVEQTIHFIPPIVQPASFHFVEGKIN